MKKFNPLLYFITDSTDFSDDEFLQHIDNALSGGVTLLQLREKSRTTKEYLKLAQKVHIITAKYNVPLIIDDRLDVALASGAEGVHLGSDDMPISLARKIAGKHMIIGATAKTVDVATKAYKDGADYLGVGAIFPTNTKVKTVLTSTDTLASIAKSVPIPVNAIGGLNTDNIGILKDIAIDGICVVSAIMKAEDPCLAAQNLRLNLQNLLSKKETIYENSINHCRQ